MTDVPEASRRPVDTLVARNLPISNTGRLPLAIHPLEGGKPIEIQVNQSALLFPGEYEVIALRVPANGILPPTKIAQISYDRALQHFNIKAINKGVPAEAQFSILLNLTDL